MSCLQFALVCLVIVSQGKERVEQAHEIYSSCINRNMLLERYWLQLQLLICTQLKMKNKPRRVCYFQYWDGYTLERNYFHSWSHRRRTKKSRLQTKVQKIELFSASSHHRIFHPLRNADRRESQRRRNVYIKKQWEKERKRSSERTHEIMRVWTQVSLSIVREIKKESFLRGNESKRANESVLSWFRTIQSSMFITLLRDARGNLKRWLHGQSLNQISLMCFPEMAFKSFKWKCCQYFNSTLQYKLSAQDIYFKWTNQMQSCRLANDLRCRC